MDTARQKLSALLKNGRKYELLMGQSKGRNIKKKVAGGQVLAARWKTQDEKLANDKSSLNGKFWVNSTHTTTLCEENLA